MIFEEKETHEVSLMIARAFCVESFSGSSKEGESQARTTESLTMTEMFFILIMGMAAKLYICQEIIEPVHSKEVH